MSFVGSYDVIRSIGTNMYVHVLPYIAELPLLLVETFVSFENEPFENIYDPDSTPPPSRPKKAAYLSCHAHAHPTMIYLYSVSIYHTYIHTYVHTVTESLVFLCGLEQHLSLFCGMHYLDSCIGLASLTTSDQSRE